MTIINLPPSLEQDKVQAFSCVSDCGSENSIWFPNSSGRREWLAEAYRALSRAQPGDLSRLELMAARRGANYGVGERDFGAVDDDHEMAMSRTRLLPKLADLPGVVEPDGGGVWRYVGDE